MGFTQEIKIAKNYIVRKNYFIVYYYLTYNCNSRCKYCDIPDKNEKIYADPEKVKNNLTQLSQSGTSLAILTGGEPLLYPYLKEVLIHTKKIGMKTVITTNGLIYSKNGDKIKKLVDQLEFSLSTLDSSIYLEERGVNGLDKVLNAIKLAVEIGEKPILSVTVTDRNISKIYELVNFAVSQNIKLILKPEFSYTQNLGLSSKFINEIKRWGVLDNVWYNEAYLSFILSGGNNIENPRCQALTSTIAISPDNCILIPCYHHKTKSIEIKNHLKELLKSDEIKLEAKMAGRYPFCRGCAINCYFEDSFLNKFDYFTFLDIKSRIKFLLWLDK